MPSRGMLASVPGGIDSLAIMFAPYQCLQHLLGHPCIPENFSHSSLRDWSSSSMLCCHPSTLGVLRKTVRVDHVVGDPLHIRPAVALKEHRHVATTSIRVLREVH
jgi:hypothetical protein